MIFNSWKIASRDPSKQLAKSMSHSINSLFDEEPKSENHLFDACYENDVEKVRHILENGGNINARGNNEDTALHIATQNDSLELVNILIKHKIDVNARTQNGWTALHFAAQKGFNDVVAALIDAAIDVNIQGKMYQRTALHFAADRNHIETIKILLNSGAKVNLKDIAGNTPLLVAEKKSNSEAAQILINKY
ncbi:MAG: ankyrin repeat protein [Lentimonas sp.]